MKKKMIKRNTSSKLPEQLVKVSSRKTKNIKDNNIKNGILLTKKVKKCMKEKISSIMKEFKNKKLYTKSGALVINSKQAIAIALNVSRKICDPSVTKKLKLKKKVNKLMRKTKKIYKNIEDIIKIAKSKNKVNNADFTSKYINKLNNLQKKINKLNDKIIEIKRSIKIV